MPKTVSISGIYARKTLKNGGKRIHKREGIRLKEREEGIEIGIRKNLREKSKKRRNMRMIHRMNRGRMYSPL
jgi:N6-adenosine-specific RNA methylase IME4